MTLKKIWKTASRQARRPVTILCLISILTFLICFNNYFAFGAVDTKNSIDGSWQYTLSGLRHGSQALGVDVFFNYGPLFEKSVPFVQPQDGLSTFVTSNVLLLGIFLLCCVSIVLFIKYWVPRDIRGYAYVLLAASYIFLTINQIDTLFLVVAVVGLLAVRREKRLWVQFPMLLGLQLFSFYKFSLSLFLLVLSPLIFFTSFKKRALLRAFYKWLGFMGMYLVSYMALTGDMSLGFFKYIYYGLTNAMYYNEFMSLPFAENRHLLALVVLVAMFIVSLLIFIVVRTLFLKKGAARWDIIICNLIVFAGLLILFKHAVVRNDGHLLAMSPFLFFPLAAFIATSEHIAIAGRRVMSWLRNNRWHTVAALAAAFVLAISFHWYAVSYFTHRGPGNTSQTQWNMFVSSLANNRLDYGYYLSQVTRTDENIHLRANELAVINVQLKELDKGNKLLFYGNTTMFGALLDPSYTVLYAPFLQHYSAHPPKLFDPLYVDFLRSHPDALIFAEENEPSIDRRIPAHELNTFFQYITHNYKVVAGDEAEWQYVLERVSDRQETCTLEKTITAHKKEQLVIPKVERTKDQYLKLKIDFQTNLVEKLISTAIKSPIYSIDLRTPDGGVMQVRSSQSILAHGIAVDPLYTTLHDSYADIPFNLHSIVVRGGINKEASYRADFELCTFK